MRKPSYCYWSVCTGEYASVMRACVASARAAGVFKEFHVFTDRVIEGCICYDAMDFEPDGGLYRLLYLKAGMSKLNFEHFIWIDADTRFVRQPRNILDILGRSPIHLPLEVNLREVEDSAQFEGVKPREYEAMMKQGGVLNDVYFGESALLIVHHDVVDCVYELATNFLASCKAKGQPQNATIALSLAMQSLCGDPGRHLLNHRRDLWAPMRKSRFAEVNGNGTSWRYRVPFLDREELVDPAIVHVGDRRCEQEIALISPESCNVVAHA